MTLGRGITSTLFSRRRRPLVDAVLLGSVGFVLASGGGCGLDAVATGPDDDASAASPDSAAAPDADLRADGASPGDAASTSDGPVEASACNALCPAPHGACAGDLCVITCGAGDNCDVVCPPGIACKVACNGAGSCTSVSCPATSPSCQITCAADSNCGALTCDGPSCNILCAGVDACASTTRANGGTIRCAVSEACKGPDVECGSQSCGCHCSGQTITCTATTCSCPGGCS